jgi:DNA mismatch endonuclease (patch repair protein)
VADIVDAATRSRMMRGIRGKNTRPELQVRRMLHAAGFRYRLHERRLPGTPDLVFPKHKAVVFVSGCFWHGHDCQLFRLPGTRTEFWRTKIEKNRQNDLKCRSRLESEGWRHATIWECALRGRSKEEISQAGEQLASWLRSGKSALTVRG